MDQLNKFFYIKNIETKSRKKSRLSQQTVRDVEIVLSLVRPFTVNL